ncbi:methyltransferase [Aureimonas populi]|uniref:Methyltransferase n=1 Tax=Aureimonas populi TaxID=1701758 RepID=A0ABW5CMK6_9HYPH|nr:methyltransferase [Aureimonas populi]
MSFPDTGPTRIDAFFGGAFHLVQPDGWGYRSGLDAMLLAACVDEAQGGRAADLGAGAGAVGIGAAARAQGLHVTLVEKEAAMAGLARASLGLAQNAALAGRLHVCEMDALAPRPAREAAGLPDGGFGLVLTNPPFYPAGHRASPDAPRRAALSAPDEDFLVRWVRVAAALLEPRGRLALLARPADLLAVLEGARNRLGSLAVLPVHTRPGPATRMLVSGVQGSRREMAVLPGLELFGQGGRERLDAISAGQYRIDGLSA